MKKDQNKILLVNLFILMRNERFKYFVNNAREFSFLFILITYQLSSSQKLLNVKVKRCQENEMGTVHEVELYLDNKLVYKKAAPKVMPPIYFHVWYDIQGA